MRTKVLDMIIDGTSRRRAKEMVRRRLINVESRTGVLEQTSIAMLAFPDCEQLAIDIWKG